jgi:hypothetical protein
LVIIRQIKEDTEIRNKENREINNVNWNEKWRNKSVVYGTEITEKCVMYSFATSWHHVIHFPLHWIAPG